MTQLFASAVKRIVNSSGKTAVYKRFSPTRDLANLSRTNTPTSYTIKIHMRTAQDTQLEGAVHNQMREVRIPASNLGFIPEINDQIEVDSKIYKVEAVDIRNHAGVNLLYILKVRGN